MSRVQELSEGLRGERRWYMNLQATVTDLMQFYCQKFDVVTGRLWKPETLIYFFFRNFYCLKRKERIIEE